MSDRNTQWPEYSKPPPFVSAASLYLFFASYGVISTAFQRGRIPIFRQLHTPKLKLYKGHHRSVQK